MEIAFNWYSNVFLNMMIHDANCIFTWVFSILVGNLTIMQEYFHSCFLFPLFFCLSYIFLQWHLNIIQTHFWKSNTNFNRRKRPFSNQLVFDCMSSSTYPWLHNHIYFNPTSHLNLVNFLTKMVSVRRLPLLSIDHWFLFLIN
jgi:hypothetical protein